MEIEENKKNKQQREQEEEEEEVHLPSGDFLMCKILPTHCMAIFCLHRRFLKNKIRTRRSRKRRGRMRTRRKKI